MLIFDQLRKNDQQLRWLAFAVLCGLLVLLGGLWWIQIVSARDYEASLQTQSFRTVRIPAVRGPILDRNGIALAENRPVYDIVLYLDELRPEFDVAYDKGIAHVRAGIRARAAAEEQRLGRRLKAEERKPFTLTVALKNQVRQQVRYQVASNVVAEIGAWLRQPLALDPTNFLRHYEARLALPFPVLRDLNPTQVALFLEQANTRPGVDLDVQSIRTYPHGAAAAHLLGYLKRDNESKAGEESYFSYRLPDFRGLVGIEGGFDDQLRGRAGAKSVLVNNLGYRQTENIWSPAEAGQAVRLTVDLALQMAAEAALPVLGPDTRAAAVVLDVRNGDILALASAPAYNPNHFVQGFPPVQRQRLLDARLRPQINRATQENYPPGSIFKPLVGLSLLEHGLDPAEQFNVQPDPQRPGRGCIFVGRRKIEDTAAHGLYNYRRATIRSSNAYFITNTLLHGGIEGVLSLSMQCFLGQRTGLPTRQEVGGIIPTTNQIRRGWSDGDTANIAIGQGHLAVTPLQMAVVTAAIANGGKVLWPRLVERIEPLEPDEVRPAQIFPVREPRGILQVKPGSLALVRQAMLADVEDAEGTGVAAAIPGFRVCGKTGTAQVTDLRNQVTELITWFSSFGPYENPRYAVVVMVESGGSGGGTCAPVARKIYQAIQQREQGLLTALPSATR